MTENLQPGKIRAVFMGTPAVALPILAALRADGYRVVGVYTQPDRRSGRGRRVTASPVKTMALEHGLPVFQPASLTRDPVARSELADLGPDVIVVAAYGLFLPADVLDLPPLGCLNIHPSMLPRHRGPSPVATAILEGDEETAVSLMKLDEGMDSGPILAQRLTPIDPKEDTQALTKRLFELGAELLRETLPLWAGGEMTATPQDDAEATVTRLLERADGRIDWSLSTDAIARRVRAFQPWPGAFTAWNGRTLKIIEARPLGQRQQGLTPGDVIDVEDRAPAIVTGDGALGVDVLQLEGRRPVGAAEFLQGHRDFIGSRVGHG